MSAKHISTTLFSTLAIILTISTGALAASGATSKVFVSGPLILLFLGFCALVVVVQCIPAIIMLYTMIKAAFSTSDKKAVKAGNH